MAKKQKIVEVPLIGYVLNEKSGGFGFRNLFSEQPTSLELCLSDDHKKNQLESLVSLEANKGAFKTLLTGQSSTAGTAAGSTAGIFGVLSVACAGGVCPAWIGTLYAMVPYAGTVLGIGSVVVVDAYLATALSIIPTAIVFGAVGASRLGKRKAMREIEDTLKNGDCTLNSSIDYSTINGKIQQLGLKEALFEYSLQNNCGTRREKIRKLFRKSEETEIMRKNIVEKLYALHGFIGHLRYEHPESREQYGIIKDSYQHLGNRFGGKKFISNDYPTRRYVTFNVAL